MIQTIKGYRFDSEELIVEIQKKINSDFELNDDSNSVTINYFDYQKSYDSEGNIDFYYVRWDSNLPELQSNIDEFEINSGHYE